MHHDQAWPQGSDFAKGGGFYEFTLRLRHLLICAGLLAIIFAAVFASQLCEDPLKWLCLALLTCLPPGLVAWSAAPSARRLGHRARARLEFSASPPLTRQSENVLTLRRERRDFLGFGLVLLLACLTGPADNLALLLLFSPLIVFRLCSRLWTEVDMAGGHIVFHRTFMGLQISRQSASLDRAVGLVSGVRLHRPGEDPVFAVCAVMPDQEPLALDTMCRIREESHTLGRRLSLQLNLLHDPLDYEPDLSQLRGDAGFRGRPRWKSIEFQKKPAGSPTRLPPVAEESV
ncbi:MAG: hypothetical protein U0931_16030 [Vulcanimicrobiota bacterium]